MARRPLSFVQECQYLETCSPQEAGCFVLECTPCSRRKHPTHRRCRYLIFPATCHCLHQCFIAATKDPGSSHSTHLLPHHTPELAPSGTGLRLLHTHSEVARPEKQGPALHEHMPGRSSLPAIFKNGHKKVSPPTKLSSSLLSACSHLPLEPPQNTALQKPCADRR